jgi:Bacteriophage lambda head decoration protein D
VTISTEVTHPGAFIVSEAPGRYSRDYATIGLSQTLVTGQVLGRAAIPANATSSVVADANTPNSGALTLDATTPVLPSAKDGKYRVYCIQAATNGGTFLVEDPEGREIGKAVVAATFNNQIKFVISDGTGDFVPGDAFTVTVGIESIDFEFRALDTTATDGSQHAAGILHSAVTTDGTTKGKAIVMSRSCEVRASDLTWPSNLTATQKAQAVQELEALGIRLK